MVLSSLATCKKSSRLTRARAQLRTLYGAAGSSWRILGGRFHLTVTVPPNTTASVRLPGQTRFVKVGAGRHRFTASWQVRAMMGSY